MNLNNKIDEIIIIVDWFYLIPAPRGQPGLNNNDQLKRYSQHNLFP